jgi:hypothetical protein
MPHNLQEEYGAGFEGTKTYTYSTVIAKLKLT